MTPRGEDPARGLVTAAPATVELRGLTLAELEALLRPLELPPFRARQIFAWIHGRGVTSSATMTNLSKELRASLAQLGPLDGLGLDGQVVDDDGTRKLRLRCADGAAIETVLIPEDGKLTQCLSTQVGCGLGCRFCATATMGLLRSLGAAEIVDQVYRARALAGGERISNLVFMGMGEPMNNLEAVLRAVELLCAEGGANFSPRRITISTAGVVPGIVELGRRARQVGLAVSLNATTDEVRSQLMPINRRWPLAALIAALRDYPLPQRRRITIEYVLIAGVNDTDADARRLARLLDGLRVKINLIPCNAPAASSGWTFARPSDDAVDAFAERLRDKDLATFVRRSRGEQIAAACGQLAVQLDRGDAACGGHHAEPPRRT
jgi:23S rRNA (adenine2503-C2)-methyltransferase